MAARPNPPSRRVRGALAAIPLAMLLACSPDAQSSLTGEVEGALGDLGAEGVALMAQVDEIDRNVRELADGLRRRVKRMEARLAALEADVAKATAEGERLQDAAASAADLAAQVETLSAELEQLQAAGTAAAAGADTATSACPAGQTWNTVLQACAP